MTRYTYYKRYVFCSEPNGNKTIALAMSETDGRLTNPSRLLETLWTETRAAFALFSDGADLMDAKHLPDALRSMGVDATDDYLMTVLDDLDLDGRGHMTIDQWTAILVRRWTEDAERRGQLRARLAAADSSASGRVPVRHFRVVLESFVPNMLTAADVDEMVADMDPARTGHIDYNEFMATMVRPPKLERNLPS